MCVISWNFFVWVALWKIVRWWQFLFLENTRENYAKNHCKKYFQNVVLLSKKKVCPKHMTNSIIVSDQIHHIITANTNKTGRNHTIVYELEYIKCAPVEWQKWTNKVNGMQIADNYFCPAMIKCYCCVREYEENSIMCTK